MKKYFLITILFFGLATLYSCKEKELSILEMETAASLTNPLSGQTYVLTDETADDTLAVFAWSEAVYNLAVQVTYDLEIDLKSNGFSDPIVLGTTSNDSLIMTVFDFNKILTIDLGLEPGIVKDVSVRVVTYAKSSERTYSPAIDMTVTPYDPPFTPDQLYVISGGNVVGKLMPIDANGNYQGYAWIDAANLDFIISDTETGEVFYGDDGANGVLELNGAAAPVAAEGHYRMAVNTFTFAYTAIKQQWAIIGSAIPNYDWGTDVNMAYIGNHKWEISTDTLTIGTGTYKVHTGKFKFRPNDGWEPYNFGDGPISGHPEFLVDGIPDEHGADIDISEGNWKITLDLDEFPYLFTVVQIVK